MGGVPVKHHTKGKVGRRRSHHALKATSLLACTECKAPVLPHRVCGNCGTLQTRTTRAAEAQPRVEQKQAAAAPVAEETAEAPADEVAADEAPADEDAAADGEAPVADEEVTEDAAPAAEEGDENRT